MPIDKTQEPTLEEKYGPVALRYLGDEKGTETVGGVAGLDVAIERLCNELSESDGDVPRVIQLPASISPSSRTTRRRSSGSIVSMSMMSAQSSPRPSR
jgi:hypothetical protein